MSQEDIGVINCLNSDNPNNNNPVEENQMSNVNVEEEKEMSLLERAQKVIKEQKEAIVLVKKLEALRAELKIAEESLEERLNSIETIDIEQVNSEIEETSSRLKATKDVLEELDDLDMCIECPREPKVGENVPIDLGPNEPPVQLSYFVEEEQEVTSEPNPVAPPTKEELKGAYEYCEKLDQEARDRKYDIADLTLDDEIDSNRDEVIDNLERQFKMGPADKDKEEFILYFNRPYFRGNGVKIKKGDYESLIKTIYSKEADSIEGKLEQLKALRTVHAHMFDEACLSDLEKRIADIQNMPF